MKFDYAIVNPPYDRNLHLKVLEQVLKVADKVINISPIRWMKDPFAPYNQKSDYIKFEKTVSKKIESIDEISYKEATKLFDSALFTMDLGIYVCGKGGYSYQHNDTLITKIIKKVMSKNWLPFSPKKFYQGQIEHKNFSIDIAPIRINDTNEIERIMCKTYESQCQTLPMNEETAYDNQGGHFEFDTEEERHNFYDCYNSIFMKWYCRLWKSNSHVYSAKIPYFGNYTHKWKLRDFFDWFDLTPAERTRVVKEIRDMRHGRSR